MLKKLLPLQVSVLLPNIGFPTVWVGKGFWLKAIFIKWERNGAICLLLGGCWNFSRYGQKKIIFGIDLQKIYRANYIMSSEKWIIDFGFGNGPKK